MTNNAPPRPVVQSIVGQHLEEAAFYFVRRRAGLWSPAFGHDDIVDLERLIDAHLSGLQVAGTAAIEPALRNLARWKSPDEAFVSTFVLLHAAELGTAMAQLEQMILDNPRLADGAAEAIFWAGAGRSHRCLHRWWGCDRPELMRAAFPPLMEFTQEKARLAAEAIDHPDPVLRSIVLRSIGEYGLKDCLPLVKAGLEDESAVCRYESAVAHFSLAHSGRPEILASAIKEPESPSHSPSNRRRWILHWAAMSLDRQFYPWAESAIEDPERVRIAIWALAFRGELPAVELLQRLLRAGVETTLAAYALCHITGLDLDQQDLFHVDNDSQISPEGDDESAVAVEPERSPEDDGLLEPDVERALAWLEEFEPAKRFNAGARYLGGLSIFESAPKMLDDGTQPQRWQSALYLSRTQNSQGAIAEVARIKR